MRAQLEVHAGDPDQPERATLELTRRLLPGFPRQRPVTLALLGFAPHPGLTATPWALDGVLEACLEAERTPLTLLTLGDPDTGEALLRKAGRALFGGLDGRDLVERPSRDRSASLRASGQRRPLTIPREVLGSSLILCTPLLLRALDQSHDHGRPRHWQGPLSLALSELARAWGYSPPPPKLGSGLAAGLGLRPIEDEREAAAAGLELITASFASASVIVDGSWVGVLEAAANATGLRPRGPGGRFIRATGVAGQAGQLGQLGQLGQAVPRLLSELESPERCLAVSGVGGLELDALLGVDHWLVKALGLPRRESELPAPSLGEASPGRWPQLSMIPTRTQPTRLADRAIAGIRTQSKRLAVGLTASAGALAQPALPARVPGRFAPIWTARWYSDHELLAELAGRRGPSPSVERR